MLHHLGQRREVQLWWTVSSGACVQLPLRWLFAAGSAAGSRQADLSRKRGFSHPVVGHGTCMCPALVSAVGLGTWQVARVALCAGPDGGMARQQAGSRVGPGPGFSHSPQDCPEGWGEAGALGSLTGPPARPRHPGDQASSTQALGINHSQINTRWEGIRHSGA